MTFGSSILLFDHITLNAGSTDTHTFNPTRIVQLSEYFRIVFVADAYNDAIGASPDYTPRIKLRVVAECASGDAYEYVLYPVNMDGMGFRQDIRLRSGEYNLLTFSIINGTSETLTVSNIMFCPESREEDITKIMDSVVNLDKAYYGVTVSEENGLTIERTDGASEALFNSDVFTMRALIDGVMKDRIYFDPIKEDYIFNGALGADAIFTDSLYAELGFVAELTVDRLTTSRRVRKYLLQDTSDDNYIQIQDHYQKFITGSVISADVLDTEAGQHILTQNNLYMAVEPPNDSYLVVQVVNRYGQRLYWQREIVSVTADGYPLDENNRQIYATTEVTDWPVLSYAYAEQVKAEYAFAQDGQYYVPQIVLGAGDNHGNSRGYIYKRQTDLLMRYVTTNGKNVDIQFSDEGYVDALHRRLSYLHIMRDQVGTGGTIYYKVEGNDTMHTLDFVEIDGLLRYTWPDGHVCEVSVE